MTSFTCPDLVTDALPMPVQLPSDAAFPPIEAILPHRGTMLLLDGLIACGDDSVEASAHVWPDAWYADASGAMPAWFGIELMAQTIAARIGLVALRAGGEALPGVLLGSQRYRANVPAFAAGASLQIRAQELLRTDDGIGAYQCTISSQGDVWADAIIKAFQPRDFQSFIEGSFRS